MPAHIRCAIYTRKSSDEGLDQAFNSLDAQHEACAAYIASQKHEGWVAVNERYDDGGVSGGTLERPALARLLAEIDAGRIAMVVVYKIDRLTRSLADFARLVERMDAKGCSFVSVTQSFNTSTSMGRLTLNVLLSFAQFEREVTAERIRDKIAASKKKGLWMGGNLPLGYDRHPDPQRKELVVNEVEAETVRTLFRIYADAGCLTAATRAADRRGIRSKVRVLRSGERAGGMPLSRGQIHYLLRNPVYRGMIRHKEAIWPGPHPAIVDEALWQEVQARLDAARRRPTGRGTSGRHYAPLAGKLIDTTGDRLTPTYTTKGGRRYAYYVSQRLIAGGTDPTAWRIPASQLHRALAAVLKVHMAGCSSRHRLLAKPDARLDASLTERAGHLVEEIVRPNSDAVATLLQSATLGEGEVTLILDRSALAERLGLDDANVAEAALTVTAPLTLRRRGVEAKVVSGDRIPQPDRAMVRALDRAHRWTAEMRSGRAIAEIARRDGHSESYVRTRAQLAFLAPAIQRAILDGNQPAELTVKAMLRRPVPLDWTAQAQFYGFPVSA